jgi:hypothetical protein
MIKPRRHRAGRSRARLVNSRSPARGVFLGAGAGPERLVPDRYARRQIGSVPPALTIFIVNCELTRARPGSSASLFM